MKSFNDHDCATIFQEYAAHNTSGRLYQIAQKMTPHKYKHVTFVHAYARTSVRKRAEKRVNRKGEDRYGTRGDDGAGFRFIQAGLCAIVWVPARRKSQKVRKRAVLTFLTFLMKLVSRLFRIYRRWKILATNQLRFRAAVSGRSRLHYTFLFSSFDERNGREL